MFAQRSGGTIRHAPQCRLRLGSALIQRSSPVATAYRLKTFGTLRVDRGGVAGALATSAAAGAARAVGGFRRARSHTRPTRGLLWPESAAATARHSLEQLLHAMRKVLGETIFGGVNPLFLNSEVVSSDVAEFERAISGSNWADAVALYDGPFSEWLLSRGSSRIRALDGDGTRASGRPIRRCLASSGDRGRADARLRRRRSLVAPTRRTPIRSAVARRWRSMRALAASGDRAAALQHARVYEALVMQELESAPDPSIAAYVAELRAAADVTPIAPHAAVVSAVAPAATYAPPPPSAPTARATETPLVETRRSPAGRRARYVAAIFTLAHRDRGCALGATAARARGNHDRCQRIHCRDPACRRRPCQRVVERRDCRRAHRSADGDGRTAGDRAGRRASHSRGI